MEPENTQSDSPRGGHPSPLIRYEKAVYEHRALINWKRILSGVKLDLTGKVEGRLLWTDLEQAVDRALAILEEVEKSTCRERDAADRIVNRITLEKTGLFTHDMASWLAMWGWQYEQHAHSASLTHPGGAVCVVPLPDVAVVGVQQAQEIREHAVARLYEMAKQAQEVLG